jgi:hypothetical protein
MMMVMMSMGKWCRRQEKEEEKDEEEEEEERGVLTCWWR